MFEILLIIAVLFIIYTLLNRNNNDGNNNDENENNENENNENENNGLIYLNKNQKRKSGQNINIGDISNDTNVLKGETTKNTINTNNTNNNNNKNNPTKKFLDNLNQAENQGDDSSLNEYVSDNDNEYNSENTNTGLPQIDTGFDHNELKNDIIDVNKIEQIEEEQSFLTSSLMNQLDVPVILGDLFIGNIAEKAARIATQKTTQILGNMRKHVKNPKIIGKIMDNIKIKSKLQTDMIKRISSKYKGKALNGRFVGGLNKRMKSVMYGDLMKSIKNKIPFKGPGASSMSKIGLQSTMKMTGNAAKSMSRMGAKFAVKAVTGAVSYFTIASTIVDLIDPFGFENMQSNKQYYRMKRKMDLEWARMIYDEYNDIEREKKIKGIYQDEYIPLTTPMYWGPLHEIHANEAAGMTSPTVENTKDQINRERIMISYMNNLLRIIDREFDKFLENDANWSEFENKLKSMKEYLICAEVEEYNDIEREQNLHKYFTEWGFVTDDDIWEEYKNYIPKYECKAVPPDVTGAKSATKYSEALVEQNLIPYEAAFLYLQIFIVFMEKIAIPGAYRMVCEEFPTRWVKNTLSRKDIKQLHNKGIDEKWDMLNQLEQAIVLLGNMRNDKGGVLYDGNHHYMQSLLKLYKRQVMSMEVATSEDCTLNYFNDHSFNITNDDVKNIKEAINISTDYFNKSYEGNDNVENWLGGFNSMKINPSIVKKDKSFLLNLGSMISGENKCEPSEYCQIKGPSSIPVIGNMFDLIDGNNSCGLKSPSFTFNFEPEEYVEQSCNINCFTEWTDWEFTRLLNKYRPDIEKYMEKNNVIYKIDEYINIINDCFEIVENNDMCDPNSSGDVKEHCDKTEDLCLLDNGKFKLTETKKQQLKKLGKITIDDNYFNTEFNRLYNILINGYDNYNSRKFGRCPLNYCKQNMDRDERDDEIKKIMNSCMYRHKDSCILNWTEASADYRVPYYYWNYDNDTCYVNKNIWQYRTLCDCATKKGNGLFGRIQHNEIENPDAMMKGAVMGGVVGAMLFSGDNTALGSMFDLLKDNLLCSDDPSMQAYTCDDITNLNGDDYNNIDDAIMAGKPGAPLNPLDHTFKFGKTGYTKDEREKILKRLEVELSNEDDYMKKEKISMKIELMKNPHLDTSKHTIYNKIKGNFNNLLNCKCGIQLQPNTGDWKTDSIRYKKQICEGSLGVNISGLPDRGVDWYDETHDTYPNACVTSKDFCSETGGCWFHNKNLNPPHGLGDCKIPTTQAVSESILGTSFTRLTKKAFEAIPGSDNIRSC
tara:strand:+ start:16673 stop:20497 length:3825 start_codon:yes stop_codon:yes gene_type:complete